MTGPPAEESLMDAETLLAELSADQPETLPVPAAPVGARPPRIRYNHQALADMLISNPGISQREVAARMGYTEAWVSTIITSDAFQAYLASRREEMVDPEVRLSLRERVTALTTKSMQILQEKLSKPAENVSDILALRAFELGQKALGMGGNAPPPPPDPTEYLPKLARQLSRLNGGQVVDVEAREAA
jgi:predicted transcriptional regulator